MHSDIYIRVWGVLQGVISSFPSFWGLWWGISLARWLWEVPVTGPGTMLALWGAGWQHWLHRPQSWPKFNSGATAKQLHLTGCRTAQLWAACHGSIWSALWGTTQLTVQQGHHHWQMNSCHKQRRYRKNEKKTTGKPQCKVGSYCSYFHEISCY